MKQVTPTAGIQQERTFDDSLPQLLQQGEVALIFGTEAGCKLDWRWQSHVVLRKQDRGYPDISRFRY